MNGWRRKSRWRRKKPMSTKSSPASPPILPRCAACSNQAGAVGKRLDFLMQELHREANTLGSKSVAVETSRVSLELKVLIEQMREQVQNIE